MIFYPSHGSSRDTAQSKKPYTIAMIFLGRYYLRQNKVVVFMNPKSHVFLHTEALLARYHVKI